MSDEMIALIVEDNQKLRKEICDLKKVIDMVFTYFDHYDENNYPWCGIRIYKHCHPEHYQYFVDEYNKWCESEGLKEWQI